MPIRSYPCLMFALIVMGAVMAAPARAAEKQVMKYDVYAGGFHVVLSELVVDTSKRGRYELALDSATRGFLDSLVRWKGLFATQGWRDEKNGMVRPEQHYSESFSGDDYEVKTYRYGKDGSFKSYTVKDEHRDGTAPKAVDPALTQKTTDVLSATLAVMQKVANGGACEGRDEIFDGSRRYQLVFNPKQAVQLQASKYNVYSGPAQECTVEVKPLEGKWHEKPRGWMSIQEQGQKAGTMPTIWFAQIKEGAPAVPVKIRVKTDYGTLFMHLTGYQSGENRLKLAAQ